MKESPEDYDPPKRLVGYLQTELEDPTFIVPVFRDLDSDSLVIQVADVNDRIVAFQESKFGYIKVSLADHYVRRKGDEILFGFKLEGHEPFFGLKQPFTDKLKAYLAQGNLDNIPGFALTVAKLVASKGEIDKWKSKVFEATPAVFSEQENIL